MENISKQIAVNTLMGWLQWEYADEILEIALEFEESIRKHGYKKASEMMKERNLTPQSSGVV